MAPVGYNTMLTDYIKPDQDFIGPPGLRPSSSDNILIRTDDRLVDAGW
jgi:hypothetical protein